MRLWLGIFSGRLKPHTNGDALDHRIQLPALPERSLVIKFHETQNVIGTASLRLRVFMLASGAFAVKGKVEVRNGVAGWHFQAEPLRGQIDICDPAALVAHKMTMFTHVRTKTGRAFFDCHLPDQAALHKHTQAIVDCGKRNFRKAHFSPLKNFLGCRMVMAVRYNFKNLTALPGITQTASGEPLDETSRLSLWTGNG
jgi:hypothetical protein